MSTLWKSIIFLQGPVATVSEGPSSLPPGMAAPHQALGIGQGDGGGGGGGGRDEGGGRGEDYNVPWFIELIPSGGVS